MYYSKINRALAAVKLGYGGRGGGDEESHTRYISPITFQFLPLLYILKKYNICSYTCIFL